MSQATLRNTPSSTVGRETLPAKEVHSDIVVPDVIWPTAHTSTTRDQSSHGGQHFDTENLSVQITYGSLRRSKADLKAKSVDFEVEIPISGPTNPLRYIGIEVFDNKLPASPKKILFANLDLAIPNPIIFIYTIFCHILSPLLTC